MVTSAELQARMRSDIEALCQFEFGSASEGEREAACWVTSGFKEIGLVPEPESDIREVIAFPKTKGGADPMTVARMSVTNQQLDEMGIRVVEQPEAT